MFQNIKRRDLISNGSMTYSFSISNFFNFFRSSMMGLRAAIESENPLL